MKQNIAIIMGGFSSEYEISIQSGNVVFNHLDTEKFNVYRVIIAKDRWALLDDSNNEHPIDKNDFSVTLNGDKIVFDAVFNVIHGSPGEDGPMAGYFELINMPHTGSGQFESALTFNKAECSLLLKSIGINIAEAFYLAKHESYDSEEIIEAVGLPCFVKPNRSGSSIGISKVNQKEDLQKAIEKAFDIDTQIIIEAMIKGTEAACGVSNYSGEIKSMAVTDIVPENEFFDYEAKYSGGSEEFTPARIDQKAYDQIMEESEFIFESLNLNGIARIDYIVTDNGVPFLIEVNTIPGLSEESLLPKQAIYMNLSLGDLFNKTIQNTLNSSK